MGTDRRIFSALLPLLEGVEPVYLDYLEPQSAKETMEAYLDRVGQKWTPPQEGPFLILGMSLGGMLAVKLAQRWQPDLLVLLSTIKKTEERPLLLNIARKLPLHRLASARFTRWLMPKLSRFFGVRTAAGRRLYAEMLRDTSPLHLKWGREAAVQFENEQIPQPFIHLHGTQDHIFSYRKVEATHKIEGGTHYMVQQNAEELAELLNQELRKRGLLD